MRFIIDTHAFIWFIEGEQLNDDVITKMRDRQSQVVLSIASLWEIAIKLSLKKLKININFKEITFLLKRFDIEVLPISINHLEELLTLPHIHRDPFDRMIIAQAIAENLPVITKDGMFSNYSITTIW